MSDCGASEALQFQNKIVSKQMVHLLYYFLVISVQGSLSAGDTILLLQNFWKVPHKAFVDLTQRHPVCAGPKIK